jgi:hypothetical protein
MSLREEAMTAAEDILARWYLGELGGQFLFAQLEKEATPDVASKWAELSLLEQWVASILASILLKRGIDIPVPELLDARGRDVRRLH